LPGGEAPPADISADSTADAAPRAPEPLTPQQLYQHVRRGVVAILRNGSPAAVGTVLAGDGRILTALSGLFGRDGADVRYADGTTVHAKIGQSSKTLDLALLVPDPNHWTEGLSASEADPSDTGIHAMLPARGSGLGPAIAALKGRTDAHARGGEPLSQMLAVDVKGLPLAGAPLIDAAGSVVAVLVHACQGLESMAPAHESLPAANGDPGSCQPVMLGAPVAAIRSFLMQTPSAASSPAAALAAAAPPAAPSPWLGIRVVPVAEGVRGVRIAAVAPQSPAEQAGLKPSVDEIVAIDGQPIATAEALADRISHHAVGESANLLVFGGGQFRQVSVTLRRAP
jgi:serine protease Do